MNSKGHQCPYALRESDQINKGIIQVEINKKESKIKLNVKDKFERKEINQIQ